MLSALWCPFGRPKSQQRTEFPETKILSSCENVCSAELELGIGRVQIAFEEDTLWYKEENAKKVGDGIAVVKVGLQSEGLLSKVECSTAFSQPVEGQFRGVHHCWPALSEAQSHVQQKGHGSVLQPSTSSAEPDALAQYLDARRGLSSGEASGVFDMVKYTLDLRDQNLRVASPRRTLFGAAVLQCAKGELIVSTQLRVFSKQLLSDLRVESTFVREIKTSQRFKMTHRDLGSTLCAPCAEIEHWVNTKDLNALQTGTTELPEKRQPRLI
jgi:hypothetical protein